MRRRGRPRFRDEFIATCPWTPSLTTTSPASITAVFTATNTADGTADASAVSVNVTPVTLAGSAIYAGQNVKFTATTYSAGTVEFSESAVDLTGCSSVGTPSTPTGRPTRRRAP